MSKAHKRHQADDPKLSWPQFFVQRLTEGSFILVLTMALFMLLSLSTYHVTDPGWFHPYVKGVPVANAGGQVGAYLAEACHYIFGYFAYFLPLGFTAIAWMILKEQRVLHQFNRGMFAVRGVGMVLLWISGCGLLSLNGEYGGVLGQTIAHILSVALSSEGANLLLLALLLVGTTWLTELSWLMVIEWVGCYSLKLFDWVGRSLLRGLAMAKPHVSRLYQLVRHGMEPTTASDSVPMMQRVQRVALPRENIATKRERPTPKITLGDLPTTVNKSTSAAAPSLIEGPSDTQKAETPKATKAIPRVAVRQGLPTLDLLHQHVTNQSHGYSHQVLENLSREVEQHLLDFGIQADVVSVHPGPVVTRFELQLAAGVKVSKLTALAKDLARSLSVTSVRVVEIIPGKTVVGIELPNQNRAMVSLSDVLSAEVYQQAHSPLTLALGVDIAGHPMVVDLAKMPHLLVAGTTGSGKSVGINAMILSLLYKSTPDHVRLIMVDPKMLELSIYDGIPHLLTPVVTDMKEAASALRWCVAEMERRYRLMASFGVRNLAGFNHKIQEATAAGETLTDPAWKPTSGVEEQAPPLQTLPYIVVIIDELADMMMVVGKKVEQLIARIAQKARAAGIHLILATQRPSVDVLTGLIKSNIPTRISFQVSSKIDSRTILDQQGAEQLLGHGDMLFLAPGTGAPLRVHGAFVDDDEVHRVADDWRQRGEPEYIDEITQTYADPFESSGEEGAATEEADALYDEAVSFVVQTRKASISAVQRRFKIGYNRSARLIEEMERVGIVGPLDGGMRDVLVQHDGES